MGLLHEIKKSIRDRKNEKTIARIKKNLSVLSALDDAGDCFPYEKQVMSDILILPKDKEKNNELLQPLHLYFMTLYPKGRLSLDESADNKSIEMFTDEFIAHPKLIKNRFYYIDLQKVILMLILANLSIHNVKHAEKLLDQYYVIFRERYKARMYVQILSCNCGKMSLKRIEDLFASCAEAYEKECTILNYKADFVYHLYLLSSRTGVESPEFSGLLEDVCRRFSGMPSPVIIQLFREFCYNNEHIDLVRAYLDSLGESEYTKKYASEIDVLRVVSVFLIVTPVGGICAMTFQGMGKGVISLILTIVRELIFVVVLSYVFGIILNLGVNGVLIGFIMGLTVGSIISFIIFELFMKKIKETNMFLS